MSPNHQSDEHELKRDEALEFLFGRIDYERTLATPYGKRIFKLDRMRRLLEKLGNPERKLSIVHVAGTKGKGSTVTMIASVLFHAGFRTGTFTSPHLDRIEQRMSIDGRPCPSDELVDMIGQLKPIVEGMDQESLDSDPLENSPTYFEIITAMAFLHFVRHNVDAVLLEVGLGGRLDSTNVCHPIVSVITNISFDHTKQLGESLELIAKEKAGIIKPGVPVVSGVTNAEARSAIRQAANQNGCSIFELGADFDFDYHTPDKSKKMCAQGSIDYRETMDGGNRFEKLPLGPLGYHQACNAAVALATLSQLRRLGWKIPDKAVRKGLATVSLPARIELLAEHPTIVIDSAHNPASIEALVRVLAESFGGRRRLLIFATTKEKDVPEMLRKLLLPENTRLKFDEIVFTRYEENPRAIPPDELKSIAKKFVKQEYKICQSPKDAWNHVQERATDDDLICVTGSFFIAAEMRKLISERLKAKNGQPSSTFIETAESNTDR